MERVPKCRFPFLSLSVSAFFPFASGLSQLPGRFPCIRSYGNPTPVAANGYDRLSIWPSPWGILALGVKATRWTRLRSSHTLLLKPNHSSSRIIIPSCSTVPGIVTPVTNRKSDLSSCSTLAVLLFRWYLQISMRLHSIIISIKVVIHFLLFKFYSRWLKATVFQEFEQLKFRDCWSNPFRFNESIRNPCLSSKQYKKLECKRIKRDEMLRTKVVVYHMRKTITTKGNR